MDIFFQGLETLIRLCLTGLKAFIRTVRDNADFTRMLLAMQCDFKQFIDHLGEFSEENPLDLTISYSEFSWK